MKHRSTVNGQRSTAVLIAAALLLCGSVFAAAPDGYWGISKRNGNTWDMQSVAPGTLGSVKFFVQNADGTLGLTTVSPGGGLSDGDYGSITVSGSGTVMTIDSGAVTNAMLAGSIDLTAKVTGTLPVANGGTGITSLGTGVATWLGTPSGANLASALTTALPASKGGTGLTALSGNVVTLLGAADYAAFKSSLSLNLVENTALSTWTGSTTVVTVGTLSAGAVPTTLLTGTITNAQLAGSIDLTSKVTGTLPVANGGTGITSLGTGVATFLGTPSGANLASALTTALPASKGGTGLTSLGTGVDTWLGTPSFSNLSSAVTGDTIAGSASTNTFTNKTYDASATGNVLKVKGYIYLTHPHLADGTNATIGTTATSITYGHATFSNSVDKATNYVEYYVQVPEDIDTSVALRARIKVLLGNTDTGSQRYVLSSVSVADSAVPTSSTLANEINVDFAGDGSGASGDVETSAWTTLTSWVGALTAGQTWRIRFARDGDTSDTSTVNSTELGLVIEYGVTQ